MDIELNKVATQYKLHFADHQLVIRMIKATFNSWQGK